MLPLTPFTLTSQVTDAMRAQLRRMTAEPDATTYADEDLTQVIARYPVEDDNGQEPFDGVDVTVPPRQLINEDWIPTYDLHAAAADIWEEKAAALAGGTGAVDFSEDGQSFKFSQRVTHAQAMAQYHRKRRRVRTIEQLTQADNRTARTKWIINLPEP